MEKQMHKLNITLSFLEDMIIDKKNQIRDEPKEPMWKEELIQLERMTGLVEMERESYEQGETNV
tara:strand:- start:345 stop:536 length:192 start_codon:yes stop_codon:yes gene_type:complete